MEDTTEQETREELTSSTQAEGVVQSHPLVFASMMHVTTSYNKLQRKLNKKQGGKIQ